MGDWGTVDGFGYWIVEVGDGRTSRVISGLEETPVSLRPLKLV